MVGKDRFGGIYSALSRRDIQRLHTIFGNSDYVYENLNVESPDEMTLQQILDYTSEGYIDTTSDLGYVIISGLSSNTPESKRQIREDLAFLGHIRRKLLAWSKRHGDILLDPYGPERRSMRAYIRSLGSEEELDD